WYRHCLGNARRLPSGRSPERPAARSAGLSGQSSDENVVATHGVPTAGAPERRIPRQKRGNGRAKGMDEWSFYLGRVQAPRAGNGHKSVAQFGLGGQEMPIIGGMNRRGQQFPAEFLPLLATHPANR